MHMNAFCYMKGTSWRKAYRWIKKGKGCKEPWNKWEQDFRGLYVDRSIPGWTTLHFPTQQRWAKRLWVQVSEPGGRSQPPAEVDEKCSPRTVGVQGCHCSTSLASLCGNMETAQWSWGFPAWSYFKVQPGILKGKLIQGIPYPERIWVLRNSVLSSNKNNKSELWSSWSFLPTFLCETPFQPRASVRAVPDTLMPLCSPQVGFLLGARPSPCFLPQYQLALPLCHNKLFQRQKDLFSFVPLTNSETQPRSNTMLWVSCQVM